jgi:hypothetical protein
MWASAAQDYRVQLCPKPQQQTLSPSYPIDGSDGGSYAMNPSAVSKMELPPILCSIPQASAMIGRGTAAIYELIGGGKIRAVSDDRTLVVVESLHESLLAQANYGHSLEVFTTTGQGRRRCILATLAFLRCSPFWPCRANDFQCGSG